MLLEAAGVPVLFTTEVTYNARLLRQTAGNAVVEGMSYMSALAAITRVPAETFGFESGVGTLTTGAPADIVIWNGDPLELTTWAERVMIDGEWISMKSRQTRLLERYKVLDRDKPFAYH
jgi:imidazolonepropionase-like amidohydrolase